MGNLTIHNMFHLDQSSLSQRRKLVFDERMEKMKELAEIYNLEGTTLTLRFFGDYKAGLGFKVESPEFHTQQRVSKVLKSFLNSCLDKDGY